jgi:hypothetical protein
MTVLIGGPKNGKESHEKDMEKVTYIREFYLIKADGCYENIY